jgi:cAMP-specific phosphodiesterase 4
MIEGILATDMAFHAKHLLSMRSKLESLDIKNGLNVDKLIVSDNYSKNFENQQMVLSMCIHTSDLSNPAKLPEVFSKWTKLVYEEFFNQGEIEKTKNMTVSMLCDRKTTKINKSQVGFINFVVLPQFETMLNVIPEIKPYLDGILTNLKIYENLAKEDENL